jgi:cytochrome c oxidase subunit 2
MPTTATGVNVAPLGPLVLVLLVVAAACGGSSRAEMSPEGERGRRIANTSGCGSCHGADGEGGVGPQLAGLYGSTVTLADGSTVVADDAYIRRSITDPDADRVKGYTVTMPVSGLSDDEIEAVLAYIRELETTS